MSRDMKVNLIANTSQFKSAMTESSNQMKLINSEFKSAAAETDKYGNRLDQTGAKTKQLSGLIEQHRVRIQAIKNEQRHWTSELKKGNITETEHAQKQAELARRLNNTEAEMKKYQGQLKRMNAEGKAATRTYADFDRQFRHVGRTMRNVGAQVGITAGIGFMAMKRVLGDIVTEAKDFHYQMAEVKAISGATGSEIEKLTQQSKDLGRQTKFTAQEAAESQANLARAGFEVNEIYDAMPGLLDLAASSNMELGRAASITSNIIRGFSKDAKESGHIADVLAKGAATANTDVEGLGQAMEVAAPVANSLSIEFESVAAAAGIMADAGIDGSKSGRMLRQGMLRLSKPTGQAADLIKDLGINAFDADGNMKSLDSIVGELQKGLKGQSKQAKAAALATIFGSESTAGWTVLLEKGSDELKKYTTELENSDGAAKDMADTMMDSAEGAIVRMESALSGLKIELGEKLLPTLGAGADLIGDLANEMAEMDDATAQTIAETALLVTAVLGVTTAVAGLVAGIGAFMAFAGPVGLAIAGGTALLGGLAAATYKSNLEAENAKKVNLDAAESLVEQAASAEKSADTFDKLSEKANISNAELAELYDLNKRIADSTNSDEIAKLQSQYDKLAEKSGLSKDELKNLFTANEEIIEQSPNVEKSVSNQGHAFVESTDKVREYIESLYEASRIELESEREKQLDRIDELQGELNKKQRQYNDAVEALSLADEIRKMSQQEIFDKQQEITDAMNDTVAGSDEWYKNNEQLKVIQEALSDGAEEYYWTQSEITEEKRESLAETKKDLDETMAISESLSDVWLKQAGITEEGEKGRIALEEKLTKNQEELSILDKTLEKNGQLTTKEQEKYDKLVEQNGELQTAQDYINNQLELYGSVNSLVESKKDLLSEGTLERVKELEATHDIKVADGDIINQLQEKQQKLVEERDQLEENRQKQGANKEEIDKQIEAIDKKINKGDDVILSILEELDVLELVKDGIELNSSELESFLVGLGYTVDEAAELARVLVGDTVDEMEAGAQKAEEAGKKTGKGHASGIESTNPQNEQSADFVTQNVLKKFGIGENESNKHGKNKGQAHGKGVESTKRFNIRTTQDIVNDLLGELGKGDGDAKSSGTSKGTAHKTGLDGTRKANISASSLLSNGVTSILSRTTDGGGGRSAGSQFSAGVRGQSNSASSAGTSVATSGESGLRSVSTVSAGTNFVSGFKNQISSGRGVWSAAWSLGKSALSALRSSIKTASPSKETEEIGHFFGEGFINSISASVKDSRKSAEMLGRESLDALSGEIENYKHSFAKLSAGIEQNKQKLVVEHSLSDKFNEFSNLLRQSNDKENSYIKSLLTATLEQNQILMQLLKKETNIKISKKDITESVNDQNAIDALGNYF